MLLLTGFLLPSPRGFSRSSRTSLPTSAKTTIFGSRPVVIHLLTARIYRRQGMMGFSSGSPLWSSRSRSRTSNFAVYTVGSLTVASAETHMPSFAGALIVFVRICAPGINYRRGHNRVLEGFSGRGDG